MDEAEKQRHAQLTAMLHQFGAPLVRMLQDAIRTRSFASARDDIVATLDIMAEISAELGPLDRLVLEEGEHTRREIKERAKAEFEAQQQAQAEAAAAVRAKNRAELAAMTRRNF